MASKLASKSSRKSMSASVTTLVDSFTAPFLPPLEKASKLPFIKKYLKELRARRLTFQGVLIIICAMAIDFSMDIAFNAAFAMSTDPDQESCFAPTPESGSIAATQVPLFVQNILFFLAFPIMGWLADSVIGRGRAINLSLRLTWLGLLLQMISYCIQYGTCGLPVSLAKYGLSGVALIVVIIGNAGFYSNMLAYGLDQMQDSSSSQVRAFVHWLVWAMFVGFFTDYLAFLSSTIYSPYLLQISAICIFIIISIVVAVNEIFQFEMKQNWKISRENRNPYKLVYGVMKYAWNHKSPAKRSALTYWEDKIPSRIDLGKQRYGGPFSDEEPEDVKTFWQIVGVFLSFFGFFIPYYVVVNGIFPYINQMEGATTTFGGYGGLVIYKILDQQVFFLIPIFELIILPMFPKIEYFFTNPLRGLSVTYIFLCIGVWLIFIINTTAHLITEEHLSCYDTTNMLSMHFAYYAIPLFFTGLADFMSYLFVLEFICSQAPANMSGMLLGVFWFVRGFYLNIGALLQLPFYFPGVHLTALGKLTCSFWVLLVQAVICTVGVAVNLLVGKYYRRRKRGEDYHTMEVVTKYTTNALERMYSSDSVDSKEVFSIVTQSFV